MARSLLLGSNNQKKRKELAAILEGLPIRVFLPSDLGSFPSPVEDGDSFEANAEIKARYYSQATQMLTLADDSGLMVDALDGAPGIFSSRYAGEEATDRDNCEKLLKALAGIPEAGRTARFVCSIVIVDQDQVLGQSTGKCEGRILDHLEGAGGFGYDPMFLYPPEGKTFAELPAEMKNNFSHRAEALKGILPLLKKLLSPAG